MNTGRPFIMLVGGDFQKQCDNIVNRIGKRKAKMRRRIKRFKGNSRFQNILRKPKGKTT
jgi:translation initiation factor IF-1